MTENDLSRIYRESSREEPTAEIDAAILAAAHREVKSKPRRFATRAWGIPLSAAAVLLISATLVLVALDEPEFQPARSPASENKVSASSTRPDSAALPPAAKATVERQGAEKSNELKKDVPVQESIPRDSSARFETKDRSAAAEGARPKAPESETESRIEADDPKEWLARIERLRAEDRTDEARKSLARFKERYPDYVLPDWAKAQ